jgi:hypothetical protein
MVVPRAIGKGEQGARIPENGLYPGHVPMPTRTSWISSGQRAMRGSRSVGRVSLPSRAPQPVTRGQQISRARDRVRLTTRSG